MFYLAIVTCHLSLVAYATGQQHQTPVTVAEVVVETVVVVVVWPQERGRKINGDAWFRGEHDA